MGQGIRAVKKEFSDLFPQFKMANDDGEIFRKVAEGITIALGVLAGAKMISSIAGLVGSVMSRYRGS